MSLAVWEHKREEVTPVAAALVAAGALEPPGLHVEVIGGRGDYVTVLIISGALKDPNAILYVEGHGAFEIVRAEPWADSGRFLVLRAWPNHRS